MSNGKSNQFADPLATGEFAGRYTGIEIALLACAGMVAACALVFVPMPLRVPGHAILKAGLPIACGVALVSRPLSGTVTSASGLLTSIVLMLVGVGHLSAGAIVSLISFGPAVDVARRKCTGRWQSLLRLAVAGVGANLLAFGVRWGVAFFQNDLLHSLDVKAFLTSALISFVLCGLAAGLVTGVLCSCRNDAGISR